MNSPTLNPLNVFLTFDVEIWCDGWDDIDTKFPAAFSRYVYGRSGKGDFGLPMAIGLLREHGLRGTFFVEPLFACRFGPGPLEEIVGLIKDGGQDVQLHLHTEWADEARPPILTASTHKRQHLFQYSLNEQIDLIATGKAMLEKAGAGSICAFRAGSYGCNRDTLRALHRNSIGFDSSVNPSRSWSGADLPVAARGQRVLAIDQTVEFPITIFADRPSHLRQVQVGSTSLGEFVHLIQQAHRQQRAAFVIVSHNFELLVPDSSNPDPVVVRRFASLCRFLGDNRTLYPTVVFPDAHGLQDAREPSTLTSSLWRTGLRTIEQVRRRLYR